MASCNVKNYMMNICFNISDDAFWNIENSYNIIRSDAVAKTKLKQSKKKLH